MEHTRSPYKKISKIPLWQMTLKLILLAGFVLAASICFVEIVKGIMDTLGK